MINQNDLYDITYALIIIRSNIHEIINTKVLNQIIDVLKDKSSKEDNQIRKAIASIDNLNKEYWAFVYYNNIYTNHKTLKNKDIYTLLIKLLQELICVLNNNNFERAYDLVDCFHCLPEIIANNHFVIPKSYWTNYINFYRNKWDKDFLCIEQKLFRVNQSRFRYYAR